jgi:radical SAM-linked protein
VQQPTEPDAAPTPAAGATAPKAASASDATPPAEPRQRWRLTFRRDPMPADSVGRVAIDAWQAALAECGLRPAQLDAAGRPRISFGAPLPAAAAGERELADIWIADRVPLWRLREVLASRLPAGHRFVTAEDVWLGAPPLPGRVVAADWRVEVEPSGIDMVTLATAAARLLAASTLPRTRSKNGIDKTYDLRPLLADVRLDRTAGGVETSLRVRTRFDPELGAGRPEEVVAALGAETGFDLQIVAITRERLLLAEDLASLPPR